MNVSKVYKHLTKSLAQLVSLTKMYKTTHPMVVDKTNAVYKEMCDFFANYKQPIVFAKSADMVLINGEKVESEDKLMIKFIEDFCNLEVGSIEFEENLPREEFDVFINLISRHERVTGPEKLKQFLTDKKVQHMIPRAATFKLVQENEDIVKKGGFVKVENIPPEMLEKFSKDFTEGKVVENLKGAEEGYRLAAHNPDVLAGIAFKCAGEAKGEPVDVEKTLLHLADYLIDEIQTSKDEDDNRNVLEQVKEKLLVELKDKPEKKDAVSSIEKAYATIDSALQVKKLLSLYKRHKKAFELSVGKVKRALKKLPKESNLYQKTVKMLKESGPVSVDEKTFE